MTEEYTRPERRKFLRHFLPDMVYGAIDGLITTSAIPAVMTLLMLFVIGVGRGLASGLPALRAGLEMLLIGAWAAAVAYGAGALGALLVDGGVTL